MSGDFQEITWDEDDTWTRAMDSIAEEIAEDPEHYGIEPDTDVSEIRKMIDKGAFSALVSDAVTIEWSFIEGEFERVLNEIREKAGRVQFFVVSDRHRECRSVISCASSVYDFFDKRLGSSVPDLSFLKRITLRYQLSRPVEAEVIINNGEYIFEFVTEGNAVHIELFDG